MISAVVVATPFILSKIPSDSRALDTAQQITSLVLLPSLPITLLLSNGNMHDTNLWIVEGFSCLFYTVVLYSAPRLYQRVRNLLQGDRSR